MRDYILFVHPTCHLQLVEMWARDKWKQAYRNYRRQRRELCMDPNLNAQEIMLFARMQSVPEGELGEVRGFTIKLTNGLPKVGPN